MKLLRVATYNINCCRDYIDAWGDKSPRAIADFIEKEQIEICGLNEVDINSERSLGYNQPEYVIDKLEETTGDRACMLHPLRKRAWVDNEYILALRPVWTVIILRLTKSMLLLRGKQCMGMQL